MARSVPRPRIKGRTFPRTGRTTRPEVTGGGAPRAITRRPRPHAVRAPLGAPHTQKRMKKGFYTIMSAQFFSSLADNALLVGAIELLKSTQAPAWQVPALTPMFALFYVLLAPLVGAFADAVPKGRVMFVSNTIKVV